MGRRIRTPVSIKLLALKASPFGHSGIPTRNCEQDFTYKVLYIEDILGCYEEVIYWDFQSP